ncbi:SRPBCC domain-containing protein [Cellulomonas dongxiuzhuiae]|uniref:SRPBCC domain-containing protein n=1 Tax=Cellulomonas dongxiuzhuiae TaxID=2819979 RepID=A0ABX8GIA4_9CELL|nr:SRPBCC domain-containing protein [Cellulomonas dongxiuzhuiae]MBO3094565.1 SRPBCC domain-containing protein [Cellulomonas dongxiuzhuiae]QWC15583.1 SRPBCC domain-containing protein [Cellulomonas dongxiuzhuiae]
MTAHQTTALVDDTTSSVTRTVRVDAPPARVFEVLTREDLVARWFGQRASLPDLRVGGTGTLGWDGEHDVPLRIEAYDPPRRFAFAWPGCGGDLDPASELTATFTLVPDGTGTLLTVVETGFDRLGDERLRQLADHRDGWTAELDELVALVAGGVAV